MKDLSLLKSTDVFQNFPDEQSLNNVMDEVYNLYYKNWNYKYILDRGPAGTIPNLMVLKKHFKTGDQSYFFSSTSPRGTSFLDYLG